MAERKRLWLNGSERAEYEHINGPLPTDSTDPRFVLVTEEEEERILAFPQGIPPRHSQDPFSKARIAAATKDAAERRDLGVRKGDTFEVRGVKPDDSDAPEVRVEREDAGDAPKKDAPKSKK